MTNQNGKVMEKEPLTMIDTAISSRHNQEQLQEMRPTLIVGGGGSGQIILTCLKAILQDGYGDKWRQRICLLAFDTTAETFQVQSANGLVSLETGSEFFDIGDVPVSSIVRNIDSQAAIKERLGPVLSKLPAGVMRSGSKQLRALGLMALLWNHPTVNEQIRQALWQLAGRNQAGSNLNQQQGINVFICGSMVGGTGSGAMLDLAYLIRDAFSDLGTQAEFCHITGIGVLPQAFHGIKGPNMLPNTAAFLQELNSLMVKGNFEARYPDGRYLQSREAPFDIYYVVDGVDEAGRTWTDINAVCAMAAHAIYLQMGTQMGKKGANAFDNLDDVLAGLTADGQGTFLASFGKGDLLFNAPGVARVCTYWLLHDALEQSVLRRETEAVVTKVSDQLLHEIQPERARPFIQRDPETKSTFQNDLPQPGWLPRKPANEIAGETSRYLADYGQARIANKMLPQVAQNGDVLGEQIEKAWQQWLQDTLLTHDCSLPTIIAILHALESGLAVQIKGMQKELTEQEKLLTRVEQAYVQAETAVSKAASSFPVGRSGRIRDALNHCFRAAQAFYHAQFVLQCSRAELAVGHRLHQWTRSQHKEMVRLENKLTSQLAYLHNTASQEVRRVAANGIATISLADAPYIQTLYQRHKPVVVNLRGNISDVLTLSAMPATELRDTLLATVASYFDPILHMSVEDVIAERRDEMSPQARRQQLFQLATPSWNVDRARLPEGGAGLARLEVMGLPDANNSIFETERMKVSTYDPYRLTALVVAAGAPPIALQQYDQYISAMEQVRGKRPLHVLPEFLVTADQGRLLFALGSIFGLIYSQGAFFYYQPADPLEPSVKLANGLSKAIQTFSEKEELLNEVNDRIEGQIARLGLQEAIQILTEYYSNVPNGNTQIDEQLRELKRLVRDYADSLRRIDAFSAGMQTETRR